MVERTKKRVPESRMFAGKRYRLYDTARNIKEAKQIGRNAERKYQHVRISPLDHPWQKFGVFSRSKIKEKKPKRGPRRFDGVEYRYDGRRGSMAEIRARTDTLRKSGYRYRVVGNDIYKRKKSLPAFSKAHHRLH